MEGTPKRGEQINWKLSSDGPSLRGGAQSGNLAQGNQKLYRSATVSSYVLKHCLGSRTHRAHFSGCRCAHSREVGVSARSLRQVSPKTKFEWDIVCMASGINIYSQLLISTLRINVDYACHTCECRPMCALRAVFIADDVILRRSWHTSGGHLTDAARAGPAAASEAR